MRADVAIIAAMPCHDLRYYAPDDSRASQNAFCALLMLMRARYAIDVRRYRLRAIVV